MRILLALAAALLLTAGCLSSPTSSDQPAPSDAAAWVAPPQPKVDAAVLLADLKAFAAEFPERHDNVPTHEGARQWILQQFADAGLTTWRQNFTMGGLDQANLVGIHWGQVRDQWVVVGGHYDTTHDDCTGVPAPTDCMGHKLLSQGAYDDGSGTMMSVELAKAFANVSTYYTVAFVAYDGEERGLQGARAFTEDLFEGNTPWGDVTVHAALDIDMFGITWPGTDAPTQILDNSHALHQAFDAARKAIGMPDDMVFCESLATLGSSDFQEYFDRGVPTVFFSSDFSQVAVPGAPATLPFAAYPFWHLDDNFDTMTRMAGGPTQLQQGFQTAADLSAAVLHAMADQPTLALDTHDPPPPAHDPTGPACPSDP